MTILSPKHVSIEVSLHFMWGKQGKNKKEKPGDFPNVPSTQKRLFGKVYSHLLTDQQCAQCVGTGKIHGVSSMNSWGFFFAEP
jgi:hypothetical protein